MASKKGRKAALTPLQKRFAEEYLIDLNATEAAVRAGYSKRSAGALGHNLLQKPDVAALIQELMDARSKRTEITADKVLQELARVAFSNMKDYAQWGTFGVALHDSENLKEDAARCVAEVSQTTSKDGGSIKFKLHDKVGALGKLGEHLKLFTQKHEHSGPDGGVIPVINYSASGSKP